MPAFLLLLLAAIALPPKPDRYVTDRAGVLKPWLEGVIREVMGGKVSGPLQARQPLRDLGMDSLMAVELRNHIAATTNLALPMSALFEHPSLDDLCRYIARQWALEGGVTSAPRQSPKAAGDAAEPIAIVGAACRFPGRVATLDDLWQLLVMLTARKAVPKLLPLLMDREPRMREAALQALQKIDPAMTARPPAPR